MRTFLIFILGLSLLVPSVYADKVRIIETTADAAQVRDQRRIRRSVEDRTERPLQIARRAQVELARDRDDIGVGREARARHRRAYELQIHHTGTVDLSASATGGDCVRIR